MRYPPIDPDFWEADEKAGMTEEEIRADWIAYCDGLEDFHERIEPSLEPQKLEDVLKDIIRTTLPKVNHEGRHSSAQESASVRQ
jgi:hypothetical protein